METKLNGVKIEQKLNDLSTTPSNPVYKWLGRSAFVLVLFTQAIILNHFLVLYENIKFSPHAFVLAYLPAVLFWVRGQISKRDQVVAAAVWFLYSLPLATILGWIFGRIVQKIEKDSFMDHGMLKNTLGLSALMYLLLDVEDYTPRLGMQVNWVKVLDILDYSDFFGLLLQRDSLIISDNFKTTIIAFGLLSILLTSVSLVRFTREHPPDSANASRIDPQLEITRLLLQIVLINFPFCALRIFIWYQYQIQLSAFTFKNFLMVAVNFAQIAGFSLAGCACCGSSHSAPAFTRACPPRLEEPGARCSSACVQSSRQRKRESKNIDLIDFEL
ncbi:uncharacterized protein LOC116619351 [Nematostella vectensis]|uniref:uncharacterized protein LOC116619351 n=1 Tax=Nematostella vectensis TaxID=45351 RepID=UPI0020778034|nr:uncharacterized protein LOC116619351 [Nematostella vectensis]